MYSVQCRQKVKLSNANVHSSIILEHGREKESAIIMCVFSSVLAYVSGYIFLCVSMFLHVYVFTKGAYLCHCQYVQAGSGGQLCACVSINQSVFYVGSHRGDIRQKTQQQNNI